MTRFFRSPLRLWLALFGVWLFLLTGVLDVFSGSPLLSNRASLTASAPGLIQWWRLTALLDDRRAKTERIQGEIQRLQTEIQLLESNAQAQEREVRRTLNYARPDEIIFEIHGDDLRTSQAHPNAAKQP